MQWAVLLKAHKLSTMWSGPAWTNTTWQVHTYTPSKISHAIFIFRTTFVVRNMKIAWENPGYAYIWIYSIQIDTIDIHLSSPFVSSCKERHGRAKYYELTTMGCSNEANHNHVFVVEQTFLSPPGLRDERRHRIIRTWYIHVHRQTYWIWCRNTFVVVSNVNPVNENHAYKGHEY